MHCRAPPAVFEAVGADVDGLYSAPEAFEVAQAYAKAAKLEEGAQDNKTLVLDAALCDALFKGVVKKGETYPTHLAKARAQLGARGGGPRLAAHIALPLDRH